MNINAMSNFQKNTQKLSYIQSIAWTKYVKRKGSMTQNHSGRMIRNPIVSISDTAKYSQYFPVDFVVDVIMIIIVVVLYIQCEINLF